MSARACFCSSDWLCDFCRAARELTPEETAELEAAAREAAERRFLNRIEIEEEKGGAE